MLVRSRMTSHVHTAAPETTLAEALATTRQYRIRHLPVLQDGRLVGLLSDRDLRLAIPPAWAVDHAELLAALNQRTVGEIMITKLVTASPDMPRAFTELFGAHTPSTRLEVQMPNRPGELARVVRLIGIENRVNITGMVVPPLRGGAEALAIIHLQTQDATSIVYALRKVGYRVGSPSLETDPAADLPVTEDGAPGRRENPPRAMAEL